MEVKYTYIVKKQFALNSEIYNKGDLVELDENDAKSLVEDGKIEAHVEEDNDVIVAVDTKGIQEAIRESFSQFAPKANAEKKGVSFGEFLKAVATKSVEKLVEEKAITVGTDSQGGYATTELTDPQIDVDLLGDSGIAQLARQVVLNGTDNVYKYNTVTAMNSSSTVVNYENESASIDVKQPTVTQYSISLVKATYMFYASEEALADTGLLVSEILNQAPVEFSKKFEAGIINGDTAFTGIIGSAGTVQITPKSTATPNIDVEDIDNMMVAAKDLNKSVFICGREAWAALRNLEDSAGNRLWMSPSKDMGGSPYGTLLGLPIYVSNHCPTLGEDGDVILANMQDGYRIASKGGLKLATSSHVRFLNDEVAYKFTAKVGGKVCSQKITVDGGTVTADFITIAPRGSENESSSSSA